MGLVLKQVSFWTATDILKESHTRRFPGRRPLQDHLILQFSRYGIGRRRIMLSWFR